MITNSDLQAEIIEQISAGDVNMDDFDVPAIVDAVIARFGLIPLRDVPDAEFWAIVSQHDAATNESAKNGSTS